MGRQRRQIACPFLVPSPESERKREMKEEIGPRRERELASRKLNGNTSEPLTNTHMKGQHIGETGENGFRGEGQSVRTLLDSVIDLKNL